jgi:RNA polymerase sigma factor (sigma-70 family)
MAAFDMLAQHSQRANRKLTVVCQQLRTIDMAAVSAHWAELPRREQRILTLRFYGNMTQAEIAGELGCSQMHVSRLQARALRHLRRRLLTDDPG